MPLARKERKKSSSGRSAKPRASAAIPRLYGLKELIRDFTVVAVDRREARDFPYLSWQQWHRFLQELRYLRGDFPILAVIGDEFDWSNGLGTCIELEKVRKSIEDRMWPVRKKKRIGLGPDHRKRKTKTRLEREHPGLAETMLEIARGIPGLLNDNPPPQPIEELPPDPDLTEVVNRAGLW